MSQLIVTANKLNKRNRIPAKLPEPNGIIGTVNKGFSFEGTEILQVPNPALGRWFRDKDGSFYWGGGLMVESGIPLSPVVAAPPVNINIAGLPINLPADFRLGVDVSHHNESIDWDAIKNAGGSFVFIKISEGVGTRDPKAKINADNAKLRGLRIGYYHFCHPDKRVGATILLDATAEADEALQIMRGLPPGDLPLVLDLERFSETADSPLNKNDYLLWVTTFIERIENKSAMEVMIYGNASYLNDKLPAGHTLGKNRLWLAGYPKAPDLNKVVVPHGWTSFAIWQYTESGVIGRNRKIDVNILTDTTLF